MHAQTEHLIPMLQAGPDAGLYLLPNRKVEEAVKTKMLHFEKFLKLRRIDLILFNAEAELFSFQNLSYPDFILDLCKRSFSYNKGFYINPEKEEEAPALPFLSPADMRAIRRKLLSAMLFVPLIIQERQLGWIHCAGDAKKKNFDKKDLRMGQIWGKYFSFLFSHASVHKGRDESYLPMPLSIKLLVSMFYKKLKCQNEMRRLYERFEFVMELSNLLHASNETQKLLQFILNSACRVLKSQNASLFMMDEEAKELYFQHVVGKDEKALLGERIPVGEGIAGLCAQSKKTIIINKAATNPLVLRKVGELSDIHTQNLIACPLLADGKCIGVIEALNTIDRSSFTQEDKRLFESFAASVAIALQKRALLDNLENANIRLKKELTETMTLHAITDVQMKAKSADELFRHSAKILAQNLAIGNISILIYDEQSEQLLGRSAEGIAKTSLEQQNAQIPAELAEYVYQSNKSILLKDDEEYPHLHKYCKAGSSYILIVLRELQEERPYGVLCLSEPEKGQFDADDFRLLSTIGATLSKGYSNFLLQESVIKQKALETEMEIASQIQQAILPKTFRSHMYVDIAARAIMARFVGGDLYYHHSQGREHGVSMLIGDVSGKSITAALFMTMSSAILRTLIRIYHSPAEILSKANHLLYDRSNRGMFVTVFLARYEPITRILHYASGGHNHMLYIKEDGGCVRLSGVGKPLGIIRVSKERAAMDYENQQIQTEKGGLLALYTDGITEAINADGEEFGLDRLSALLVQYKDWDLNTIIDGVFKNVMDFCKDPAENDDLSLLLCRFL